MPFNKGDLVAFSNGPYALVGRYLGLYSQDLSAVVRTYLDGGYRCASGTLHLATRQQIDNAIKCDLVTLRKGPIPYWMAMDGGSPAMEKQRQKRV